VCPTSPDIGFLTIVSGLEIEAFACLIVFDRKPFTIDLLKGPDFFTAIPFERPKPKLFMLEEKKGPEGPIVAIQIQEKRLDAVDIAVELDVFQEFSQLWAESLEVHVFAWE